jgi:hypothetical protein
MNSRRLYRETANIIREQLETVTNKRVDDYSVDFARHALKQIATRIGRMFQSDSDNFNMHRFLTDCGF